MLSPKRTKFRKQMKGKIRGKATRGFKLSFGKIGLLSLSSGWLSARQIESARIALTRHLKREGKVWIRVFPDKPITKKPAETRMGKGKGPVEEWVAVIKPGRVLYEIDGVHLKLGAKALTLAAAKLPFETKIIKSINEFV